MLSYVSQFGTQGTGPGQFESPVAVAVNPKTGDVYVTDVSENVVEEFSASGTYMSEFSGPTNVQAPGGPLAQPTGIAVDPTSGDVYVLDFDGALGVDAARVQQFDASGNFMRAWTVGTFFTNQIAVDPVTGNVYVTDQSNNRVDEFNSLGTQTATFGSQGTGTGQFEAPTTITVDPSDEDLYVGDTNQAEGTLSCRVQKFDSPSNSFNFLFEFGGCGSGDGQFLCCGGVGNTGDEIVGPTGMAVDPGTGDLYAVDAGNNRLQVFDSSGNFLTTAGWGVADGASQFETCTSSCQRGISGNGNGQFNNPFGVALDPAIGELYVVDNTNDRVEVFSTGKVAQSISFTAPSSGTVGGSATLTATGGGSGNPVVFSVDPSSGAGVCNVSGTNGATVNYTAAGSCVIDANQAGNASYLAAPQVTGTITVNQAPTFVQATPPLTAVTGQAYSYTFEASGTPAPSYALAAGAPSWLSINAGTGELTGTPPAGTTSFSYSVTATNVAGTATAGPFTVTATQPPAVKLAFVTQPSGGTAGQAFGTQPAVAVEDADGNVVTGDTSQVKLSITAGTGASGAVLSCTANPVAASAGVATFAGCAIGKAGTGYELHAIDGTLTAADSSPFTVSPGSAAKLVFVSQPSGGTAGQAFGTQPAVAVEDADGNVVTGDTSQVTLSITPGTGASGAALACAANSVAVSAGVATFAGCAIAKAGTGYELHAIDGTLTAADSGPFTVSPGSAAKLVFVSQPSGGTAGQAFGTQPAVAVEDADGNVVTGDTSQVTLSITAGTGASGAALACAANSVAAAAGVATFAGCAIAKAGSGYELHATDGTLSAADSDPFTVSPGPAAKLAFVTQPSGGTAGQPFGTQPAVAVEDTDGNVIPANTSQVKLSITPGTGASGASLFCLNNPVAASAGVATFAGCAISKAGAGYQLHATDGTLAAADSGPFTVSPGPAAKLVFITQPSSSFAGQEFARQPAVAAEDAEGDVVTTNASHITLSITPGTGTSGGALTCAANPVAASGGVARFSGCAISEAGTGYRLHAANGVLTAADSAAFTITQSPAINHFTWSMTPIAAPGGLKPDQQVTLTVTALNAAGKAVSGGQIYLSLTKSDTKAGPGGPVDDASAVCGPQDTKLPAYCPVNPEGQVRVTYTAARQQYVPGNDVLTAAVDPFGTDAAPDQYTYAAAPGTAVASYSWSPDPIAPAGTLRGGATVKVTLMALDANGNPVASAKVSVAFTPVSSNSARLTPPTGSCSGSQPKPLSCQTGKSGALTFDYNTTGVSPGGSDGVTASYPPTRTPPATIPAPVSDTYSYDKPDHYDWSVDPVAAPGSLTLGQKVTLTVTALTAADGPASNGLVYLSLTKFKPVSGFLADNASAACLTSPATPLPGYCRANSAGQVRVAYTSSSNAVEGGADTLTAAVDPEGNGAATDQYVYPAKPGTAVASYSWSPDPIAAAATLARGKAVPVTVTALDAQGIPVPGAPVRITLTKAPGSNATLTPPTTGCNTSLACVTGKDGSLAFRYVSSTVVPQGGSDGLTASQPKTLTKTPAAPATDSYTYSKVISQFTWTTDPIALPGSLKPSQQVTLTATARNAAGSPVAGALVYVSLTTPAPGAEPKGDADNASATCGTTTTVRLPAYCPTNGRGQVQVTYTASNHGYELGSDVLTAAVDPYGTDAAADQYTYMAPHGTPVASYSWSPDPLAAAEGLPAAGTVQATLTALGAEGNPIPGASVTFVFRKAPSSDATLTMPAQGCTKLTCETGKTGTITVIYTSSGRAPAGGSDAIIASQPTTNGTAASPSPAVDYYSYS